MDVPVLKDELDRKVFETLEYLIIRRKRGQISQEYFEGGIDCLFMAVNGLVRKEFIEIITIAQEESVLEKLKAV